MSRIRADKFVNNAATGAPQLTYGAEVVAGVGLTGAGGINVGGAVTAASVTAASGNFTGAVTVGGVLTYEDVTNIDSIGIITARSDVSIAEKIIHTGDTDTARTTNDDGGAATADRAMGMATGTTNATTTAVTTTTNTVATTTATATTNDDEHATAADPYYSESYYDNHKDTGDY